MGKGGGDNNQQKSKPGVAMNLGLDADQVTDDSKLAGMAVIAVGALGFLLTAKYIRTGVNRMFGIKSGKGAEDSKPLASAEAHEAIGHLKKLAADKPSVKAFTVKEMLGAMSPEERSNIDNFMKKMQNQ